MKWQIDRQIDILQIDTKDSQIDRQINRKADRQKGRLTVRQIGRSKERQIDGKADRQKANR